MLKGKSAFILICFSVWITSIGCGDGSSERKLRKKIVADSIRIADSLEKNKVQIEAMKHSLEDSLLAVKEFEAKLSKYDSVREMDSLKVKWKHRDPIKPAPKRELGAKSPIK